MSIYLNNFYFKFFFKKNTENNSLNIFINIREIEKRKDINLKFAGFLISFNNQNKIFISFIHSIDQSCIFFSNILK